jgi:hypothetical protein
MKSLYFILSLIIFIPFNMFAQSPIDGPLSDSYIIQNGGGDELVTLDNDEINIYKYSRAMELFSKDTLLKVLSWPVEYSQIQWCDIDLKNLDNDATSEILAVGTDGSNGPITVAVLKVDPSRIMADPDNAWKKTVQFSKTDPPPYEPENWEIMNGIFIKGGNFDSDSLGEFVVAYWADDGKIEIVLYDVSDSLEVTELATIRDQEITEPAVINLCEDEIYLYEIEAIDFNNDGIDEILVSGRKQSDTSGWQIFANVYSYNESEKKLERKINESVYTQTDENYDIACFDVTGGKFFNADTMQAVIGFLQYTPYEYPNYHPDTLAFILVPFKTNEELNVLMTGNPVYLWQDILGGPTGSEPCYFRSSTLTAADVNDNGTDELLAAFSFEGELPSFKIYSGNQSLGFSVYADLSDLKTEFQSVLACGDFERDSSENIQRTEIIISSGSWNTGFYSEIYRIETLPDDSFDQLRLLCSNKIHLPASKTDPLLAGNLDADIRLGKPKRYSVTDILQPLVILNAPPIHFDVFDGVSYDVCKSYNENEGKFIAEYIKESEQSTEVRTEINRDWSISGTLSAGFSFWGVSVSSYLTQTYGKKFSKVEGSSHTVTVGFQIEATVDDQIYATVMDYDLWEYPVYGDGQLRGHVLVVEPQIVKNSWFDSKSWKGYSYIPNHEVGNILSYRHYPLLSDNPMLIEKVKGDYGFDTSFLLSGNSSYDWYLNFQDFTESQSSTTKEFSRDWGVSVSFWGAGFSMNGSYNSEDIQTQRTTVESGIYLDVHLDGVDMSMGETRYEVTPYAYWANNGALVVDYAVAPELAGPGGEDTWWDAHYGYLPDPAFILPWRYDPEKGDIVSEAKRYQTKDIIFKPQDPKEGEIITIYSEVHNFSLIPTPGLVGVKFFVGDPDSGGTLITGEGGITEVFTESAIPSRGTEEVEMQWKVPEGIGTFPRIYAVIDADHELTEIHENNNKSWNILQKSTTSVKIDPKSYNVPSEFKLYQNYPNPFNPITRITFSLPEIEYAKIDVYNLLGQKVATLLEKQLPAGQHSLDFNTRNLGSGIYYYTLEAGNFRAVKKMVLMK